MADPAGRPIASDGNVARTSDSFGPASQAVEALARRDRLVTAAALTLITLLAWAYLLAGAGMDMDMGDMDMNMVMPMDWTVGYALIMFLMWWIMMIAMMLPSAAPMILLFALVKNCFFPWHQRSRRILTH